MYSFLVGLFQPFTVLYLLTLAGVINLWRKRRETRRRLLLVAVPLAGLTLLCIPAVSHLALGTLEWPYPPRDRRPDDAQAIVVLAAGVIPPNDLQPRAELDEDTLRRCLHAADLYRQGKPLPVVVSGGKVDPEDPGPPAAQLMRDFLIRLGVRPADLVVEENSRTTFENAAECRKVLEQRGLTRVVLVADAVDMFRAVRCFRKQGVEVVPSPCHYRAAHFDWSLFTFLPSPGAARGCQRAWHEWLGTLWYRLRGRI